MSNEPKENVREREMKNVLYETTSYLLTATGVWLVPKAWPGYKDSWSSAHLVKSIEESPVVHIDIFSNPEDSYSVKIFSDTLSKETAEKFEMAITEVFRKNNWKLALSVDEKPER